MIKFVGNPRLLDCCEKTTIEDVVDYCSKADYLAVDTETTGLNHIEDRMIMLQIGDHLTQFVIDVRYIDISQLKNILEVTHEKLVSIDFNHNPASSIIDASASPEMTA